MDASKREYRGSATAVELHVPATLHASLIARLDHLGPEARGTAQAGSVIGREFSYALLRRMSEASGIGSAQKIESSLNALVGSGLIFVRGTVPEATYTFKHALVQDAAYSTLLRTQRQKLHAALASIMSEEGTVAPEVLGYHFAGAGISRKPPSNGSEPAKRRTSAVPISKLSAVSKRRWRFSVRSAADGRAQT